MDDERGVLHGVREDSVESGPGQAVCGGEGDLRLATGEGGWNRWEHGDSWERWAHWDRGDGGGGEKGIAK